MLGHPTYYNGTIRKYVAAFGDVFSDISITRERGVVKVPISFLPKSKWYVLSTQRQVPGNDQSPLVQVTVPRIAFSMEGMTFDGARMRPRNNSIASQLEVGGNKIDTIQFTPTPYDFKFQLSILTENISDQLQIIEQIVPFFTPSFNLSIKDNPLSPDSFSDITLRLESVTTNMDVEGNFDERRLTSAELEFTLKGLVYGPTEAGNVIRDSTANTRDFLFQDEVDNRLHKYNVKVDPLDAAKDSDYGLDELRTDFTN